MNRLFGLILLALAFLAPVPADAACSGGACFWIGGAGTVDGTSDNGKWSLTSGGASCACVPAVGDTVTFDASSGTGTITINMGGALWTVAAFTGSAAASITWDFATNSNSLTMTTGSMALTGASSKTLTMGSGTFTISGQGNWDTSGAGTTITPGTSTIAFTGTGSANSFRRFFGGGKTYANLNIGANSASAVGIVSTSNTFSTITIVAPNNVWFEATQTVTTFNTITGTASNVVMIGNGSSQTSGRGTISTANNWTCAFCTVWNMTVSGGGTFTANNSFGWNNTGSITVNGPSGGGGGRIIGG